MDCKCPRGEIIENSHVSITMYIHFQLSKKDKKKKSEGG